MKFNEDSRVKIPTIIHLTKLGYKYISLKDNSYHNDTNIFEKIFLDSFKKINSKVNENEAIQELKQLKNTLNNDDLGEEFFKRINQFKKYKIIDFENLNNNTFNVVTELTYKKDDDEFRPDITLLINGLPLVFIEVKKPNNKEGLYSEKKRIFRRFKNKKFKNFFNITQLIIFTNNMNYEEDNANLLQGSFYACSSYDEPNFNFFREEEDFDLSKILNQNDEILENEILKDNNLISIKNSKEFITNKDPYTATNKICTSLLSKERLIFLLRYGFAYIKKSSGVEKHIIRYPQLFAAKAIKNNIDKNINKGIIWHTQGSGKTALAYFALKYLKDYFSNKNTISKYYFIVDRIDLLKQATKEFRKRGLSVIIINSKAEFAKNIKSTKALHNDRGNDEIIIVNIQKFENDENVVSNNDYNLDIQRVYFLDEVHRSYKPKGSFLTNLHLSDKKAIKIGLTGTPLINKDIKTRDIFGDYIHRYFYNSSIKDGYTLRLIREEIENQYREKLQQTIKEIKVLKGNIPAEDLYSNKKFVEPMLDYIVEDYQNSKIAYNDDTIGAMVICDSYKQAEQMFNIFNQKYLAKEKVGKAELILYDVGTKDDREDMVENFKEGKINFLFVYNMLLTGFDSPRLKKIYFGRKIKSHNLLQALTRVNRPYKDFRYGYVVDFADIEAEFKKTNQAYFDELQTEFGDELKGYENLFKTEEQINLEIEKINSFLFRYETDNIEVFSKQISEISDKKELNEIQKMLISARELYNVIRISDKSYMLDKLNFKNINHMYNEVSNRISLINQREIIENKIDNNAILNFALEDLIFSFKKIKEEELIISDQYKNILRKTRESLISNFDVKDFNFISLRDELQRLFGKKDLSDISESDMNENIDNLTSIYNKSKELNRKNELLKLKYDNDAKYARIHKRLMEKDPLTDNEIKLFEALKSLKKRTDDELLNNSNLLENETYVKKMISRLIIEEFNNNYKLDIDVSKTELLNNLVTQEYMNEHHGI